MTIPDIRSLDPGTRQYLESWWTYKFEWRAMNFTWDWAPINHHTLLVNLKHFQWSTVEKCHVQRYFWPIRFEIPRFVSSKNSKNCNHPGCPDLDVYILHNFFRVSKSKGPKYSWGPHRKNSHVLQISFRNQNLFGGPNFWRLRSGELHLQGNQIYRSSWVHTIQSQMALKPPDLGQHKSSLKMTQRVGIKDGKQNLSNLHSFWSLSFCNLRNIFKNMRSLIQIKCFLFYW